MVSSHCQASSVTQLPLVLWMHALCCYVLAQSWQTVMRGYFSHCMTKNHSVSVCVHAQATPHLYLLKLQPALLGSSPHPGVRSPQPGVVGVCEVTREAYPDPTAADEAHKGYDAQHAAVQGAPRWSAVDVRLVSCRVYCFEEQPSLTLAAGAAAVCPLILPAGAGPQVGPLHHAGGAQGACAGGAGWHAAADARAAVCAAGHAAAVGVHPGAGGSGP